MFEINVYSIINSNMFDVAIDDHFLFSIGVEVFYDCKQVVELKNTHANNANWGILHAN
jgi:hypothetical protein